MRKAGALCALTAAIACGAAIPAFADCICLGNGQSYGLGETACLKTPSGTRPARCDKVLNNTSWTFVGESCDVSGTPVRAPVATICDPEHETTPGHLNTHCKSVHG
jgi:hypothetical protein